MPPLSQQRKTQRTRPRRGLPRQLFAVELAGTARRVRPRIILPRIPILGRGAACESRYGVIRPEIPQCGMEGYRPPAFQAGDFDVAVVGARHAVPASTRLGASVSDLTGVGDARSARYECPLGKTQSCTNLNVVRSNHAMLCREIGSCSFAAGFLAGKTAVIVVPKALESTVKSP